MQGLTFSEGTFRLPDPSPKLRSPKHGEAQAWTPTTSPEGIIPNVETGQRCTHELRETETLNKGARWPSNPVVAFSRWLQPSPDSTSGRSVILHG